MDMNKFDIIITISDADPSILMYSISSLFMNRKYLDNIVFAIEKDKTNILNNVLREFEFCELKIIETDNNSTKIHKLNRASKFIGNENLVIVLDEDDYLLNLESLASLSEEYDLLITPFYKYQNNKLNEMSLDLNHNHIPICSNNSSSFIDNFNSIAKASIFKTALKMAEFDFQKFEGVFRGIAYLGLSKNPKILKERKYSFLIWTKFTGRNHMSSQVNLNLAVNWMKNLLKNFQNMKIESIKDDEINCILKSNLLRIYRTARVFHLENLLTENEMNIIRNIMINCNIDIYPSRIYNEEMLGVFDISLNKYTLGDLI